jgi:hypothetical protein
MAAAKTALMAAHDRQGKDFKEAVGNVDWDVSYPNQTASALAVVSLPGGGYAAGLPKNTCIWAVHIMACWLEAARRNPLSSGELPPLAGFGLEDTEPLTDEVG